MILMQSTVGLVSIDLSMNLCLFVPAKSSRHEVGQARAHVVYHCRVNSKTLKTQQPRGHQWAAELIART